jgi:type IV secretion system protein VirB1
MDFIALVQECAPTVSPQTMAAVVKVESSYNPYAIGVVGGYLKKQPTTLEEALATVKELADQGYNFSVGLAQVNRYNFEKYNLTFETAFNPCENLRAGSEILKECYVRALKKHDNDQQASLRAAFSCYYSGNFLRGFTPDKPGQLSYVDKVVAQANHVPKDVIVPDIIPQSGGAAIPVQSQSQTAAKAASSATAKSKKSAPVNARLDKNSSIRDIREGPSTEGRLSKIRR